ncbi:MAG TPA: WD40 repeat domain-containing protein [Candidatus Kapabacteria bacterium]|nr:WD40 repeat domain-containing protein [Candidatus Kapabacteria bacterium]
MKRPVLLALLLLTACAAGAQLRIVSPNGGEHLVPGTIDTIRWAGVDSAKNVVLEYSASNGATWNLITAMATGLQYAWLVPDSLSTQCLLRISYPIQIIDPDSVLADGKGRYNGASPTNEFTWDPTSSYLGIGGTQEVLDATNLKTIFQYNTGDPTVSFGNDGRSVLFRTYQGGDLISLKTQTLIRRYPFGLPFIATWLPDYKHIMGISPYQIVFDTSSPIAIDTMKTQSWTYSMSTGFNPQADRFVLGFGTYEYAILFDLTNGDSLAALSTPGERMQEVVTSPDGSLIASVGLDSTVAFWDGRTGAQHARFEIPNEDYTLYSWSPDNRRFAIQKKFDTTMILDAVADSVAEKVVLPNGGYEANSIQFHPSGAWLAIECGGTLYLYDTQSWNLLQTVNLQRPLGSGPNEPYDMIWSPNGKMLAIRDAGGRVSIYYVDPQPSDTVRSASTWTIGNSVPQMFNIRIDTASAYEGTNVFIPVVLTDVLPAKTQGASSVTVSFHYDKTLLAPLAPLSTTYDSVARSTISFPLTAGDSLGTVNFTAALGDDSTTALHIDTAYTDSPDALLSYTDGQFTILGICRQGGAQLIDPTGTASVSVEGNVITNNTLSVQVHTIEDGTTQLYLVDVLGRMTKMLMDGSFPLGTHGYDFEISDIPDGKYLLVLQTPTAHKTALIEVIR